MVFVYVAGGSPKKCPKKEVCVGCFWGGARARRRGDDMVMVVVGDGRGSYYEPLLTCPMLE